METTTHIDPDFELLRASDVMQVLGIGRTKAYQLMQDGTLPVLRIGKAVRVPKGALLNWIHERTEALDRTARGEHGE